MQLLSKCSFVVCSANGVSMGSAHAPMSLLDNRVPNVGCRRFMTRRLSERNFSRIGIAGSDKSFNTSVLVSSGGNSGVYIRYGRCDGPINVGTMRRVVNTGTCCGYRQTVMVAATAFAPTTGRLTTASKIRLCRGFIPQGIRSSRLS